MDRSYVCRVLRALIHLNPCSAQLLVELHALGTTRKEIEGSLQILPFVSPHSYRMWF